MKFVANSINGTYMRDILNEIPADAELDGGEAKDTWERLFYAGRDTEYTIPRYGLNSLAEVVGWARPEVAPPRNGRTSKALRALGFDVKVY